MVQSVSKTLNSIHSTANKSKSFLNKTKKKMNHHKKNWDRGIKTLKNTTHTLKKSSKPLLSQIDTLSKTTSNFLPDSLNPKNEKKRETLEKSNSISISKPKLNIDPNSNNKQTSTLSPSLFDDITNIKNIFISLGNINTDNESLNKQLKSIKAKTQTQTQTQTQTPDLTNYSDNIDQLLSFMNDSSIATMHLAYLNLQKGYIFSQLKKLQPLLDKIYGTYETIKSIMTTVDDAKDSIMNIKNKAESLSSLWVYLQYLLGIFAGTLLSILSKTTLNTLDKINLEKILRVIHQIKEEEMEYFLKAFENKNHKNNSNTKNTNGMKLAQTVVLLLYLIHRTIMEGVDNIDQGLLHIEPLFKKLLKIAGNIDTNIIGPLGDVAMTAKTEIDKNKELIQSVKQVVSS